MRRLPALGARTCVIAAVVLALSYCTDVPTDPGLQLHAAAARGGNGGNGGNGNQSTNQFATFVFQELDLYSDTAGAYVHGQPSTCGPYAAVTDTTHAGMTLYTPKGKKPEDPACRRAWIRLDQRHYGFLSTGEHDDGPVAPVVNRVVSLAAHVDDAMAPIGRGKINFEFCNGGNTGLRFNPDRVAGSTHLQVTGDASNGWRVYSDLETIAGCVELTGDTTYWHVDVDYAVTIN